jgi:hypothetical protein
MASAFLRSEWLVICQEQDVRLSFRKKDGW